ncbi:MAG: aminotransferase class V-fold PLP-dependent enzyme, partial [Burkholderiales bacterium]
MTQDVSLAVRKLFPGAGQSAYLDVASRGLLPESSLAVAQEHLMARVMGRADKARYFELVELARGRFAQLIGAGAAEVAITKNVSEGLNIIATAIEWQPGDEVIVCSTLEHPNNLYPWRNLERLGVRVIDIPDVLGVMPIDAMIARLGPKVRVVALSATTFRPGFRTDLERVGRACRAHGALLVVDAAQTVGITHLDVAAQHIDMLAASTQKGLCSLYGMGFLYVREAVAERMTPTALARFGVDIEKTHEADYDPGPIRFRRAALRFDVGNYNFLAANLTAHAMAIILEQGTRAIDAHVSSLAARLVDALRAQGIEPMMH